MIVAIVGGKGGVGKSTTSLNLGYELDAVVVDGDLATADLPRGDGPDLHDVLAGRVEPTEAVHRFGPVRYLPCGRTLSGARASDLSALGRAVERVERECGRVVIDAPAGLARDVGTQLASAHLAVLVTMPDDAALVDAFRTRRLALDLETPIASTVLNRARQTDDDRIAPKLEEAFGTATTVVDERAVVAEAQADWMPVETVDPDCQAVDAFAEVARTVKCCEQRLNGRLDAR